MGRLGQTFLFKVCPGGRASGPSSTFIKLTCHPDGKSANWTTTNPPAVFNGVEAPFEVISHSLISATVPEGATTGFVTVTTSAYTTLKSNLKFQVRP
jgi:hypothetical protein